MLHLKNFGFGAFLEEDEYVVEVFRLPAAFMIGKFMIRFVGWMSLAGVVFFFFPTKLLYVWLALAAFALYRSGAAFFHWYVNSVLMTNEGVILVEWPTMFVKKYTRLEWFNLDQVSVERIGVQSFLGNYGTLIFMKMGGDEMEVKNINRPHYVARTIEAYREKAMDEKNFTEESTLKGLISQLVLTHTQKNGQPERPDAEESAKIEANFTPLPEDHPHHRSHHSRKVEGGTDVDIEKVLDDSGGIDFDLEAEEGKEKKEEEKK